MFENANGADDLALFDDAHLAAVGGLARTEVARVADELCGLDDLVPALHADKLAISIRDDLVDGLVQHVRSTVDGTQTGE